MGRGRPDACGSTRAVPLLCSARGFAPAWLVCACARAFSARVCVWRQLHVLCMLQACYFWCAACSPLRRVCCRLYSVRGMLQLVRRKLRLVRCVSSVASRPLRVACRLLPLWLFRIVRTFSGMRFSVCRLRTKQQAPCNARLATRDLQRATLQRATHKHAAQSVAQTDEPATADIRDTRPVWTAQVLRMRARDTTRITAEWRRPATG
jgi:hypothetical protein